MKRNVDATRSDSVGSAPAQVENERQTAIDGQPTPLSTPVKEEPADEQPITQSPVAAPDQTPEDVAVKSTTGSVEKEGSGRRDRGGEGQEGGEEKRTAFDE